jgi:cytochrome c-type biogenesis protein CcmH
MFAFLLLWAAVSTPLDTQSRVRQIEERLLAPCCYSETVALHISEAATEMRTEIADFVAEGRTEAEILEHYKQKYGTRVLAEPDGAKGRWLNAIPVLASVTSAVLLGLLIYRAAQRGRKRRAALAAAGPPVKLPDIDDFD